MVPDIALNAPEAVGVCDQLVLDASATSGSGGRQMTFSYNATGLPNVTKVFEEVNAENGGYGRHTVVVPAAAMPQGARMKISLTVTNFLGESSTKVIEVKKLGYPAPSVSIQGTNPRETTYSDELVLRADATLPAMDCVDDSLSNSKVRGMPLGRHDTRRRLYPATCRHIQPPIATDYSPPPPPR